MKIHFSALICCIVQSFLSVKCINWQADGWANGCDFPSRDLVSVKTASAECGALCSRTTDCTHYTWSNFNNLSLCWLKFGIVSQSMAFSTADNTMVCGIVSSIPTGLFKFLEFDSVIIVEF